jgi:hypothetical protein
MAISPSAPGTSEYLPNLLNRVRDAFPTQEGDPVLFEALLTAIVTGPRHLCIRTDAEHVDSIAHGATSVSKSFPLSTHS